MPAKLTGMIGKRFGRWVVVARAKNKEGKTCWLCHCDCGTERVVPGARLRSGGSQSCGCRRTEANLSQVMDETGKRYGRWTVIKRVDVSRRGPARWLCRCDCGNSSIVQGGRLRNGGSQSCGCLIGELTSKRQLIDLTGKRFGRLTVVKRAENGNRGEPRWLCFCDCGGETIARGSRLRGGGTQSCGCLQREVAARRKAGKPAHNILPEGEASFNALLGSLKDRARKHGKEWRLTREQVATLTKQNCFYCEAEPSQRSYRRSYNGAYIYNGLDRIDSNQGYIPENVVPCCGTCNKMKNTLSVKEFASHICQVYEHFGRSFLDS